MSLVGRFSLRVTIPVVLLLATLAINGYEAVQDMRRADADLEATARAFLIQDMTQLQGTLSAALRAADAGRAQEEIASRGSNPRIAVALLMDDQSKVLHSSSMKLVGAPAPEVITGLDTALLSSVRESLSGKVLLAGSRKAIDGYYPVPLGARKGELRPTRTGVLFMRYDLTAQRSERRYAIERAILLDSAVDALFIAIVGILLHLALTRRVSRLVTTAARIASGDYSAHTGLSGSDEISRLGAAFDNMIEKIAADQRRLLTVLDSLEAVVYVADMKTYEVLFVNKYARDLFGDIVGRACWQSIQAGQAGPCDFCTNAKLVDSSGEPAGPCAWESKNTRAGRWFYAVDRAVRWVDGRVVRLEIATDITERKRSEAVMQVRLRLQELSHAHTLDELLTATLDELEALTGSTIGFYHFLDADQETLTLRSWSTNTLKRMCTAAGRGTHYDVSKAGVWADCVRERRTVIHNDYASLPDRKGLPEGHAPMAREVVVPIFRGNRIVAIVGVGNKPEPYTDKDVEMVSRVGDLSWDIVEHKSAAMIIEQAAAEWSAAMDASQDVIYLLDSGRKVLRANKAFYAMTRSDPETALGRHIATLVHPEGEKVPCPICAAQEQRRDLILVLDADHPHNPAGVPLEIVLRVIRNAQGETVSMLMTLHDLSRERKRQEEKAKAEAQYRTLLRTALDGFLIADLDGRIHEVNDAYCAMTGYRREELLSMSINDLEASQRPEEIARNLLRMREEGRGRFESSHRRKDGTVVDLDISVNYSPDQGGRFITFLRDVTERRRAHEALRESERFLESVVENIPNMIFVKDAESLRFVRFNRAGENLLGYPREELLGKCDFDFFPREEADSFTSKDRMVLDRGELVDIPEETIKTRDKGERVLHTRKIPIRDDEGRPRFLLGISEDITEHKEREAFIRNILESVDEGFIVVDREYRIRAANRAFCRLAGLPPDAVVGRPCYELSHRANRPCFEAGEECAVKRTFETGTAHSVTHRHVDAAGAERYVEIKSYPITDAEGKVVSAIETLIDITDRRRLEEQLRQSQKMEAVGQLAGGVAHDFNNILMAIMGYGTLVQIKLPENDPLRLHMNTLLESADRAAQLTRSLLAFSRKQVMHLAPASVNEIIARTEKFLRRIIGEDVELRTLPGRDALVMADAAQIEQVLMNLATNARDAMPRGGVLSIATDLLQVQAEDVLPHGVEAPGQYVVISVTDTGTGMDEETKRRIFEPFFTTKELGRGTGLGLAIVYGIVKQHHGAINAYSVPGTGSTFRIYLPVHRGAAGQREAAQRAEPIVGGTETILLAEDDPVLRTFLAGLLTDSGYTVILAEDGVDAVQKFAEHADAVQLCILDMVMPRKSGNEALREIARLRPGIKTILASGYAADRVQREGIPQGCEFIQKPVTPAVLLRKVREVLDGK